MCNNAIFRMLQGIVKVDLHTNADLATHAKKKKEDNYGKPQRLHVPLRQELENVIEVSVDQLAAFSYCLFY